MKYLLALIFPLLFSASVMSQNNVVGDLTEGGRVVLDVVRAVQELGIAKGPKNVKDNSICLKNSASGRISCELFLGEDVVSDIIIPKGKQECAVSLESNKYILICKEGNVIICKTELFLNQKGIFKKIK